MCTRYFLDIGTLIGDMPPPPLDADIEMAKAAIGEERHQMQILTGMRQGRLVIKFSMELHD